MTAPVSNAEAAALAPIVAAIEAEFVRAPPTVCVIGLSGVGKSSTVNALFGTRRTVSATTRGTSRFSALEVDITSDRVAELPVKCKLKVYDAPGLGEDADLDGNYLERYKRHLPHCDVALWIVAARNRALALDQQYLEALAGTLPNLVLGINQVDLIDPLDWNERINMPSKAQSEAMAAIAEDRRAKLGRYVAADVPAVPYSAVRFYNLQKLFATCLTAAPPSRRWMFELLKAFTTQDWLAGAKGLTAAQRQALSAAHIKSDAKLPLDAFRR